ncbi:MAG: DUF998 domain-containing protein [Promethearchaeota archaeon]
MEKLDKIYEKVNGSYFGIIGFIISFFSILIAQILYMEVDPSFSVTTNFISDLGNGPNGSDIVFNTGMILHGIFNIPFYTYLGWYLFQRREDNSLRIGMIAGIIGSIGQILVGVFPFDPVDNFSFNMHILAAEILFYAILIMLLIYGISEYRNPNIPKVLSILAFISAILYGAFMTIVILQFSSSIPFQINTHVIEWLGAWVMSVWVIAHIYYTLKHR